MMFLQFTHLEIPQLWGWFSFPTIIYGTLRLIAFTHFHPFPTAYGLAGTSILTGSKDPPVV